MSIRARRRLNGKTGNTMIPAYYMMAACAVGLVALSAVIETRGCSLRGEAVSGATGLTLNGTVIAIP